MEFFKRVNVHIYPSGGHFESRVIRSCDKALSSGLYSKVKFYVLGRNEQKSETIDGVTIERISQSKIGYILKTFVLLSRSKLTINVHNWYLLFPALYSYFFFRNRLIYEPHEVEFGTAYISPVGKKVCHALESLFFRLKKRTQTVFVGEAVRKEYRNRYNMPKGVVIRSLPTLKVHQDGNGTTADSLNTGCYVGLLTFGRGIDICLKLVNEGYLKRFVFIGHGPMLEELRQLEAENENIVVLDSKSESELYDYLAKTKPICFSLMDIKSLSNRCASPNKFFIYLASQCPIIYSDFGDQAIIARKLNAGEGVTEICFEKISKKVKQLKNNFKPYMVPKDLFKDETCDKYIEIHRSLM